MDYYSFLCLVSIILGFFPLPFYFFLRSRLSPDARLIIPFMVLMFLSSFYELVFTIILRVNVSIWFKIYPVFELFVLMHYFYKLLKGRYTYVYYFFGILYLACFCGVICLGKIDSFMEGDAYLQVIESSFVITAVLLWMKYAFIRQEKDALLKFPHFYFISGLLFYFSGTIFLFLLGNIIIATERDSFLDFWILNLVFNIVLKTLLLTGIWKAQIK
jgi:hypothetical protein